MKSSTLAVLPAFLLMVSPGFAQDDQPTQSTTEAPLWDGVEEAFTQGRFWLNFRYRFEDVSDDGSPKDAHASTMRTVLGYETAEWKGFKALIEMEDVSPVGNDLYNSTINGVLDRPVVADPNGTELNRLQVSYSHSEDLGGIYGRQSISHDDQRFIGPVGWRQNYQSFDALTVGGKLGEVDVSLGHISNVNRIFGDASGMGNHAMDSNFLHASTDVDGVGDFTAYAYMLDYDTATALSTDTYGLRYQGKSENEDLPLDWLFEFATQSDAGKNPSKIDADYMHLRVGADVSKVHLAIGYELLGGSGAAGDKFTTPLATLHAFNGWADKFLGTPDTGLEDLSLSISGKAGKTKLKAIYHQFAADSGGMDYGTEIDLLAIYPITKSLTFGLKYASYDADMFSTDSTRAWAWFTWNVPMP